MKTSVLAVLLASTVARASAPDIDIDIKGLKLGMNLYEVAAVMPDPAHFTIAGITPLYPPSLDYRDMRLTSFMWFFYSGGYEAVRDALRAKYPALKCAQSTVQNGFGASYAQEVCRVGDLEIQRYNGSLESGVLVWAVPVPAKPPSKDL